MGGGINAPRKSGHHAQSGAGQLRGQVLGDPLAVHRGVAATDQRDSAVLQRRALA